MRERMPSVIRAGPMYSVALESESAVSARTPPATRPRAPSTASRPPVGSSSSESRSATPISATTTKKSIARLSAPATRRAQRVALDVRAEGGLVGVLARLEEDELSAGVIERGARKDAAADAAGDLLVGVGVAGVGNGSLSEEGGGGVVRVLGVDAEEGDALAVLGRELLKNGKLEAARAAPGGPDVDDHREPPQRCDPLFIGVCAAQEQLVFLSMEGRQRRRGPCQRLGVVRVLAAVVASLLAATPGKERQRRYGRGQANPRAGAQIRHVG